MTLRRTVRCWRCGHVARRVSGLSTAARVGPRTMITGLTDLDELITEEDEDARACGAGAAV